VWGIFFVAIAERDNLMDVTKEWLNMFSIIFELVSAFGGIGLSLGFPNVRFPEPHIPHQLTQPQDNYSLVGAMHPISKLVIIVIM
jgi:Trk-type K+ transport system membrane component